jgi:hypothetical protein
MVLENSALKIIFGTQRDFIVRRDRRRLERKLHNEELRNLYAYPNIIGIEKSSRTKLAGFCRKHLRGKNNGKTLDIEGRT